MIVHIASSFNTASNPNARAQNIHEKPYETNEKNDKRLCYKLLHVLLQKIHSSSKGTIGSLLDLHIRKIAPRDPAMYHILIHYTFTTLFLQNLGHRTTRLDIIRIIPSRHEENWSRCGHIRCNIILTSRKGPLFNLGRRMGTDATFQQPFRGTRSDNGPTSPTETDGTNVCRIYTLAGKVANASRQIGSNDFVVGIFLQPFLHTRSIGNGGILRLTAEIIR
mmetsp:Transcript_20765/g.30942  ORF Transcript_20765/g.30942 Transcript_20765/m.30942 type:complete len:221 (-) Transcript_20765:386-1048(-)